MRVRFGIRLRRRHGGWFRRAVVPVVVLRLVSLAGDRVAGGHRRGAGHHRLRRGRLTGAAVTFVAFEGAHEYGQPPPWSAATGTGTGSEARTAGAAGGPSTGWLAACLAAGAGLGRPPSDPQSAPATSVATTTAARASGAQVGMGIVIVSRRRGAGAGSLRSPCRPACAASASRTTGSAPTSPGQPAKIVAMEHRRFGRTGLRVSRLGLGCGGFGGVGSEPSLVGQGEDEAAAFAIMDRALELGIDYFDTANSYGAGRSEAMIGRWLRARGTRDQIVLSTKVFNRMGPGPNDAGLSRRHIVRAVEDSLRRLQTDWIDLYVTHEVDPDTPLEETLGTLDDLVHQGKVRYVAASNVEAWRLTRALWISDRDRMVRYEGVQNEYNLLERSLEREVLPLAADQGLAVTPFSPLAGGFLTGKYALGSYPTGSRMTLRPQPYERLLTEATFRALDALRAEAGERGVSMGALALAWVTSQPLVTAALIGPRSPHQFAPAIESLQITLTAEDRDRIASRMEAARIP
jgi:aryl-alcohol dehydrogenase-like predicted oxidoreductase